MKNTTLWLTAVLIVFSVLSAPAAGATLSCPGGSLFVQSAGTIATAGYTTDAAEACVTVSGSTLTVTLQNDTAAITNVPETLVGFSFALGHGTIGSSISSVSAAGFIDCFDNGCSTDAQFTAESGGGDSTFPSPYLWGLSTSAGTTLGSTATGDFSSSSPGFFAGSNSGNTGSGSGFSLHPGAVVNNTDSVANAPHNDALLGPVTYTFSCNNCSNPSSGVFYWGTDALTGGSLIITSTTPEPASFVLLGAGLVAFSFMLRKKVRR